MAKPAEPKFTVSEAAVQDIGDKYIATIIGQRLGRPSKRFNLKTSALKFKVLELTSTQKNKSIDHTVVRVNYLPTKGETRIHTSALLYPGKYVIKLEIKKTSEVSSTVDRLAELFI